MKKKIVFLPYDFDTAIGTNNEGSLVFSYNLEDIDQVGNADVFNGQQSVLWKLLREMYGEELKTMYKTLRSAGKLSYNLIETAFENHQEKWPEAVFNEDSYFKYLAPLEEKGSEAYLSMLQGSKAEQRKWWLYNRFRYIDSKYNAGDALTDVVTLRGYAKANITVTPYADVYPTIKFGSYLVQTRGTRNVAYTLVCPLDNVNDTEIYIYSASQLADIGDLSGLKVGYAEFTYATRIQTLQVGSSATGYTNPNLLTLYAGNNKLLKKVDARNCTNFGTGEQKTLDLSGCSNIEEVYLDGTAVLGCSLPNGGYLKKLHLPGTITNLTILNQTGITEFECPDYSHISTLNLENVSDEIDVEDIAENIATGCRVRLYGFNWTFDTLSDANDFLDLFDGCTGIDAHGNNVADPQIYATVRVGTATGDQIEAFEAAHPGITLTADTITYSVKYYSYDGETLLNTESVVSGNNAVGYSVPARTSTAQYSYTGVGWSTEKNATEATANVLNNITANKKVYAAYTATLRSYTITFVRANVDGGGTLQTSTVNYGETPAYTGSTPTSTNDDGGIYVFNGWSPAIASVTGDATYTAVFNDISVYVTYMNGDTQYGTERLAPGTNASGPSNNPTKTATAQYTFTFAGWSLENDNTVDSGALNNVTANRTVYACYTETVNTYTVTFVRDSADGGGTLQTLNNVAYGTTPVYTGSTPTTTKTGEYGFNGWNPSLGPITGNTTYTAVFVDLSSPVTKFLNRTITAYDNDEDTEIKNFAFRSCTALTSVKTNATTLSTNSFAYATAIETIEFTNTSAININSTFSSCTKLKHFILHSTTKSTLSSVSNFTSTPIADKKGAIYVPSDLVNTYKADSNWNNFIITSIDNYPMTDFSSITDGWDTIIGYANAGTIGDHYSIGDTKLVTIDNIDYYAILAGINADVLSSDGTTKANSTWILDSLLKTSAGYVNTIRMNQSASSTTGGWASSYVRSYLSSDILPNMPQSLQSAIKEVNKPYYRYEDTSEQTATDKLWIPSKQEVGFTSGSKETSGTEYSIIDSASERKRSSNSYWLRTAYNAQKYSIVNSSGYESSESANYGYVGVLVGFCI